MSIFDRFTQERVDRIPLQGKTPDPPHPWEKTIKAEYVNKIKQAHNSVYNPEVPKVKQEPENEYRTKFKIIGDRISKEFIYCSKLAKDLHKYRRRSFYTPIIIGVSSVEWSNTLREAASKEKRDVDQRGVHCTFGNVLVYFKQKTPLGVKPWKFLGGEHDLKSLIEHRYRYPLRIDYYKESIANLANYIKESGRPCAYMHVSIDDEYAGTFFFLLYSDIAPRTVENFLRLCQTRRGGYSGALVHRIVKDCWIQCGGYKLKRNNSLQCENFSVSHDRRGIIAMCNDGRDKDCSTQFFILLSPAPWMSEKYVAFGQLIEGEKLLKKIEAVPTWHESPLSEIVIDKAGIFNMDCQDVVINKGAVHYIGRHIEDLGELGETLVTEIMCRLKKEITDKHKRKESKKVQEETEQQDIEQTKAATEESETQEIENEEDGLKPMLKSSSSSLTSTDLSSAHALALQKEFDEESNLTLEYLSKDKQSVQMDGHSDLDFNIALDIVKRLVQEKLEKHTDQNVFYHALTDVRYSDDTDSDYKETKMLTGKYCLETDVDGNAEKIPFLTYYREVVTDSYESDILQVDERMETMDFTDDEHGDTEEDINEYLRTTGERVSFAGAVVKKIGKGQALCNLFQNKRMSEMINLTDEEIRKLRRQSMAERRQSIMEHIQSPMERRQSMVERRQSVVERRQSVVERRQSPMERRQSMGERRQSPEEGRKSIVEPRQYVFDRRQSTAEPNSAVLDKIKQLRRMSMIDAAYRRVSAVGGEKPRISVLRDEDLRKLRTLGYGISGKEMSAPLIMDKQARKNSDAVIPEMKRRQSDAAPGHRMTIAERRMSIAPSGPINLDDVEQLRMSTQSEGETRTSPKKVSISSPQNHRESQIQRRATRFMTDEDLKEAIANRLKKVAQYDVEKDKSNGKRRQTVFAQDDDLKKIQYFERDQSMSQFHEEPTHLEREAIPSEKKKADKKDIHIHMSDSTESMAPSTLKRRPTAFVRDPLPIDEDDEEIDDENNKGQKIGEQNHRKPIKEQGFVRNSDFDDDDVDDVQSIDDNREERASDNFSDEDDNEESGKKIKKKASFHQQMIKVKLISSTTVNIDDEDEDENKPFRIKRRATGFVRSYLDNDDDDDSSEIVSPDGDDTVAESLPPLKGFHEELVVASVSVDHADSLLTKLPQIQSDTFGQELTSKEKESKKLSELKAKVKEEESSRKSLIRRFTYASQNDVQDEAPTLKNYKPISEVHSTNMFLRRPSSRAELLSGVNREDSVKMEHLIKGKRLESEQGEPGILKIQYGTKVKGVISTDYFQSLDVDQESHQCHARALRSRKVRPSLTVSEYQERNRKYKENLERNRSGVSIRNGVKVPPTDSASQSDLKYKFKATNNPEHTSLRSHQLEVSNIYITMPPRTGSTSAYHHISKERKFASAETQYLF